MKSTIAWSWMGKTHGYYKFSAGSLLCEYEWTIKSHRIAGFRVGWMVLSGPKHQKGYIEGLNMLSNMRLCSNVLSQHVVQTSWRLPIRG